LACSALLLALKASCRDAIELAPTPTLATALPSYTWKLGQVYGPDSSSGKAIRRIAKKAYERSNGRITINCYDGDQLGDWMELNERVMKGTVEMFLTIVGPTYDPRWNLVAAPYLATSYDDVLEFFGPGGFIDGLYKEWAPASNWKWLGTYVWGSAGISMNIRAATTPEEAKGIKIRVMGYPICKAYIEKLGFIAIPLPFAEVPMAIQTGIVDGQSGGGPYQTWAYVRALQDYFVWYHDYFETWGFVMNLDLWNSLDSKDQVLMQEIANEEMLIRIEEAKAEDHKYLKKLKEAGLTVIDLADHPDKLAAAAVRAREAWVILDEVVGKSIMNCIRQRVGMPVE
jgi:TRAP-type C4-dicarboxylate transport system substrate-binding protein